MYYSLNYIFFSLVEYNLESMKPNLKVNYNFLIFFLILIILLHDFW